MDFLSYLIENQVPPFAYSKGQIEQLYNTSKPIRSQWLKTAKLDERTLAEELAKTGYETLQKVFSKKQVAIIFEFIDNPELTHKNEKLLIGYGFLTEQDLQSASEIRKNMRNIVRNRNLS